MTTEKTMNRERASGVAATGVGAKKSVANGTAGPPAVKAPPAGPTKSDAAALAAKQKTKLVRDSFTIPKSEYAVLDALKLRATRLMRPTKKSEVLRAGILALEAMSDKAFLDVVNAVPSLKTGRPKSTTPVAAKAVKAAPK